MLEALRRRVPEGRTLPTALSEVGAFVKLRTKDPRTLTHEELGRTLVPFLVLGDGGVVALWYRERGEPPVVHVSSEGEHRVVAKDVRDFVARLGAGKTGVPELDDDPKLVRARARRATPKTKPASLAALQTALRKVVAAAEPRPESSVDGTKLCQGLLRATASLVTKGYFGPYDRRLGSWSVRCRAQKVGGAWQLEDARPTKTGEFAWQPTQHEALVLAWPKLLELVKDKRRPAYELTIYSYPTGRGISIDRDRQLRLVDASK